MRLLRPVLAVLTTLAALLALAGPSGAAGHHGDAKPVSPRLGTWEAAPAGVESYGVGGWTLGRVKGRLHMTAHPDNWNGIFVPDALKCGGTTTPPLSKPDYRLSKKATFRISDREATQNIHGSPLVRHVVWTGTFTSRRAVSGRISIWITKPPARAGAKPKVLCRDLHRKWSGAPA